MLRLCSVAVAMAVEKALVEYSGGWYVEGESNYCFAGGGSSDCLPFFLLSIAIIVAEES